MPPHVTVQAKPGGQTSVLPWHCWFMAHPIVQTPLAQPPVHAAGHVPPGGFGAEPHPPEDEALDEDEALEDDLLEVDECEDVVPDDPVDRVVPPLPASLASGRSWAPRMVTQAWTTRAAGISAQGDRRGTIRTPP